MTPRLPIMGPRCAAAVWLGGVLAAALLSGCVNINTAGSSARSNPATPAEPAPATTVADARKRAQARLELAAAYFEQGRTDIALQEVNQSLASDPGFAQAYNLRGLIDLQRNEMQLSEQSFLRALELARGNGEILHNYGYMLCQAGRYPEAQQRFDAALADSAYTGRQKTLLVSGVCQARAGDLVAAEGSLRQAFERDPANPAVGYNLADVLHRQGKDADARFYLRRINNSDQANAQTLWLGVRVERVLGNSAVENQLADQLRRRYPDSKELEAYEGGRFEE